MSQAVMDEMKYQPETTIFEDFADEYGPEKVVYVYEPRCGLKGIVVVDNSAIGPGIGGALGAPTLTGQGDLTPGSAVGFLVEVGPALFRGR